MDRDEEFGGSRKGTTQVGGEEGNEVVIASCYGAGRSHGSQVAARAVEVMVDSALRSLYTVTGRKEWL